MLLQYRKLIDECSRSRRSNIVLALDVKQTNRMKQLRRSLQILRWVEPHICAVKIGMQLLLPLGLHNGIRRIVMQTHEFGLPAIMDAKINDVGHTNRIMTEHFFNAGFDAVIANPIIGWKDGLEPIFNLAKSSGRGVLLLIYMSHSGATEGYGQKVIHPKTGRPIEQYKLFAERALEWGADGVVVGATYPEKIRSICKILGESVPIYSPGVGVQGGNVEETMRAGARYLIVGRSIVDLEKPKTSAEEIHVQLRKLLAC